MEPEEDALHGLLAYMLLGVAGSLALAAAGGWFLAGKSLAPVRGGVRAPAGVRGRRVARAAHARWP